MYYRPLHAHGRKPSRIGLYLGGLFWAVLALVFQCTQEVHAATNATSFGSLPEDIGGDFAAIIAEEAHPLARGEPVVRMHCSDDGTLEETFAIVVAASPAAVWAVLTDFASWPRFIPQLDEFCGVLIVGSDKVTCC